MSTKINLKQNVAKLIGELPELERQVLSLYYVEELTMPQIAWTLNLTVVEVAKLYTTALVKIEENGLENKQVIKACTFMKRGIYLK